MISRQACLLSVVLTTLCLFSVNAVAQSTPKKHIKYKLGSKAAMMSKPEGWTIAKAPKGSIGLFRAAGDKTSQIEIKFTPEVTTKQQLRYFQTFHTTLKKMGLRLVDKTKLKPSTIVPDAKKYKHVVETEYELKSNNKDYRMVVIQGHRHNGAWLIIGFFPTPMRDKHYESLKKAVNGIDIK